MTKQEEIREKLAEQLYYWKEGSNYACEWSKLLQAFKDYYLNGADQVLTYLHSQGVVIKVDRELPDKAWYCDDCNQAWESIYSYGGKAYCVWCLRKRLSGRTIVKRYPIDNKPELIKELLYSDVTGKPFIPDKFPDSSRLRAYQKEA